jgi:hypothetical protein
MTLYTRIIWALPALQVPVMIAGDVAAHLGHWIPAVAVAYGFMGFWAGITLAAWIGGEDA